jgi:UDP-N-acetyl-2-amino-2-deoxyglucuronate dehydrogenase
MSKDVGFGIIGCGMISNWYADAILAIDGASIIGVTDVNEVSRHNFEKKYNAPAFDSIDELLNRKDIDIVCICTPSGLHAPIAVQVANKGKNIIIEKPMALNLAEADEIIDACNRNGVKMAVISQLRFTSAVEKLKKAIEERKLGKLIMGDIYMKFFRSQEYYDNGAWRGTWKMDGGGALMNQGIHGIDLLQYVMGPVKSIYAITRTLARKIEVEDTTVAAVEFKNGALGVIQASTSIYPGCPRRLEINGDKGSIVLEEDCIVQWDIEGEEIPEGIVLGRAKMSSASNPANFSIDGHVKQIKDMINAVRSGEKPLIDQYEGRKPVEIIMAIYESSRTRSIVEL